MVRRAAFYLLIFVLSSCYGQDEKNLPVEIWLDSRWDEEERDAVIFGMERWEDAAGIDFFQFIGEFDDEEFTATDLGDDYHVVYKITEQNEDTRYLELKEIEYLGLESDATAVLTGYGPHTDILLLWYRFSQGYDESERNNYLINLANLATHESGHFLGLGHNATVPCGESAMTPSDCTPSGEVREITEDDVGELCVFYNAC